MSATKHNFLLRAVKLLNLLMITGLFELSWYLYYTDKVYFPFYAKGNWLVLVLFAVLYLVFTGIYDALKISTVRISEMIYSQLLSVFMAQGIMYIVIWLLMRHLPNILPMLITIFAQLIAISMWSVFAHWWYYKTFPPLTSAIIYDERRGMEKLISEYGMDKKFAIKYTMHVSECLENIERLNELQTVFITGIHSRERNVILKYCLYEGIQVYSIPRIGDLIMSGAKKMHMFYLPFLRIERFNPAPEYLFAKRMFDILVSLLSLIILSPVMLITALCIKVCDGGPVFYKQCRLTKDGKRFMILKFRSMRIDAEKDGKARLSSGDKDDRITPVGRFIRKVRIDELPQLFNVLSGNMSIVGPRPERPEIAAEYEEHIPEFRLRLQTKAGLTGYAQVYGKYNTTPYDKLQMDLMYIATASLAEDLKICFATVKILFLPESTEGIDAKSTNALNNEQEK